MSAPVTTPLGPRPVASLSFVSPPVDDPDGALRLMARTAVELGYALPSLPDALLDRERMYPTGLPTPLPCAIPHADARHILAPGIGLLVPRVPLDFGEMGSKDRRVAARLVVLLLVDDPQQHVGLLSTLVRRLQDPELEGRLLADLVDGADLAARFTRELEGQ